MTYEVYRGVFLISAIAGAVMLIVTVILFFALHIPKVFNDLTGRSAKKAIENIRRHNESSGDKRYKTSAVNLERGKITDKITQSGKLQHRRETPFGMGIVTEKISTQQLSTESESGATSVLAGGETTLLSAQGETAMLSSNNAVGDMAQTDAVLHRPAGSEFRVEFEITYIHTDEIIV